MTSAGVASMMMLDLVCSAITALRVCSDVRPGQAIAPAGARRAPPWSSGLAEGSRPARGKVPNGAERPAHGPAPPFGGGTGGYRRVGRPLP
ncbi:hypothetical protein GCM10009663_73770 [Kitasatospora arboriphila]|uniref:Secreted protein n=1 Tax=Kitasatospora arboriphila TaxID=258052 RepID=A0ABN1U686_9ACTN